MTAADPGVTLYQALLHPERLLVAGYAVTPAIRAAAKRSSVDPERLRELLLAKLAGCDVACRVREHDFHA